MKDTIFLPATSLEEMSERTLDNDIQFIRMDSHLVEINLLREMLNVAFRDGYREAMEDWEITPQVEIEIERKFLTWFKQNQYHLTQKEEV